MSVTFTDETLGASQRGNGHTLSASVAVGIKVTERRKPQAETQYHQQRRIPAIDALKDRLLTNVTRGMARRRRVRSRHSQWSSTLCCWHSPISVAAIGALTAFSNELSETFTMVAERVSNIIQ